MYYEKKMANIINYFPLESWIYVTFAQCYLSHKHNEDVCESILLSMDLFLGWLEIRMSEDLALIGRYSTESFVWQ